VANPLQHPLVQIVGGVFVVAGLFFTWANMEATQRNATEALKLSEKGQVTERFTRAIDRLGKSDEVASEVGGHSEKATIPNLSARLGGIISLEMIAKESQEYHWEIMEILAAYIRRRAPIPPSATNHGAIAPVPKQTEGIQPDVEAAITVIRRRDANNETDLQQIDLSHSNLPNVSFFGAPLMGASFIWSELRSANFTSAKLQRADFDHAILDGAIFNSAVLSPATFPDAQLRNATFPGAHLDDVNFHGAILDGADFRGAVAMTKLKLGGASLKGTHIEGLDLRTAVDLTCEQVLGASRDDQTQLRPELAQQVQRQCK
jgi:uncharacterized protein YjbI with pentapeptide repeats